MKKLPKRFTVTKKQTIDGQTYNVGDYALKKKRAGGGVYLNMDNGEMLGVDSDNISKLTEKFEKGGDINNYKYSLRVIEGQVEPLGFNNIQDYLSSVSETEGFESAFYNEKDGRIYTNSKEFYDFIEDDAVGYAKGGSVYSQMNLTKSELKEKEELKKVVSKSFDWYTYKKGRAWTTSDTKKLAEKLSQNIKSLKEFPQVLNRVNIREFIDELEGYSVPKNKGINYVTESLYSYFMKGDGYAKGGKLSSNDKKSIDEFIEEDISMSDKYDDMGLETPDYEEYAYEITEQGVVDKSKKKDVLKYIKSTLGKRDEYIKYWQEEDYAKGGSIDKKIDEVERSIDNETDMERMEELYEELEVLEEEKEQQLSKQKMMFGGTTSMPRGSGWGDYEKGDRVLKKKDLIPGNMYLSYSGQFDAKNVVYIMPLRDGNQFFTDKIFFVYVDPKSKTPKLRDEYDKVVNIDESDLRDNVMNYNFYKIKNHKYKKPSKFDHGGIITSKRDLDLVVGAMMKIAVDNDCTKNDSYWTKERKDRLSSLAVDMLNKHKHMYMKKEYGVGGVLAGALVGGYIGYKYGLIQEQRKLEDLFRTEKKLAKEYKQKYDDRKKKYEEGGSVMNPDTPKIYVADLKAYNEGKLIGEWIDLTDYSDGYEVQEKIDELMSDYSDKYHSGEETEHAIHDYENFDSSLYSEYMGEREYDIIIQTHNISEDKDIPAEVLQTIMNDFSEAEDNLEEFVDDRYVGEFDNDSEIGEYYVDMVGGIEGVSNPEYYFDYEALGRDLSINDYNEYDNHYFRNYKKGGEIKEYDLSKYEKGGALEKEFKFDKNFVIYVPSTSDVGNKVSKKELDKRVDEVEKYVANEFGGYTETETDGGYKSTSGEIIEEDIVKISVFANNKDWKKNESKVVSKVKEWATKWGQEAIGFEYEGDLYYIDEEGKFAKGGSVSTLKTEYIKFLKDNDVDVDKLKFRYRKVGTYGDEEIWTHDKKSGRSGFVITRDDFESIKKDDPKDFVYGYSLPTKYAKGGVTVGFYDEGQKSMRFQQFDNREETKKFLEKEGMKEVKKDPKTRKEFKFYAKGGSVSYDKMNNVDSNQYRMIERAVRGRDVLLRTKGDKIFVIDERNDKIYEYEIYGKQKIEDFVDKLKSSYAKGGVIKKGDYVRDARGELGLVNKVKKGIAYVKYPSTNPNAFEPVFLHEIKETKDMHKGRKVYTDFYDK